MNELLNEIRDYIAGRSVALVGNAQSLIDHPHPEIAEHDVIVRINKGASLAARTGCPRTDVILVSGFMDSLNELLAVSRLVVYMTPRHRELISPDYANLLAYYPTEWWDELQARIHGRPSTGCMGIDLLSRFIGTGELHLYGFDFWKTPTSYSGQNRPGPHSPGSEESYARSLIPDANIH